MSYIDGVYRYTPPPQLPAADRAPLPQDPNAQPPVPVPTGDGQFSTQVAGTQPQKDTDLKFAEMANDSYDIPDASTHKTGTESETDLAAAGWTRLQPSADGKSLVGADGQQIAINPARLDDTQSGFRAAIYQNPEGKYVIAYAGTNPSEMGDLRADAGQAFGLETKQYNQAIALAKDAEVAFGDGNVAFTGHSLGGGLASAAALATDASAVTFNAAGLSNETLRTLGFNPNDARAELADNGQVRRYVVESDPLTLAQQDIPLLPIVGSPPNAVGHELRIALPEGVTPVIGAHGGSGDNTSYVDALKQNTPYEPKDKGFVLDTLQNAGELAFNQLGTTVSTVKEDVTDIIDFGKNTFNDVKDTLTTQYGQGNYVSGTVDAVGDVADNTLDLAGNLAENTISYAGDTVRNATDAGGQLIRDAADGTFLEKPADFVAGLLEGGGNLLSKGTDLLGKGVSWGLDKLGDGVEWGLDKLGDGAQWTVDKVSDGLSWAGDKLSDGASWVGDKVSKLAPWNW